MTLHKFNPILTPREILLQGAFGGSYFGIEDLQGDWNYQKLFDTFGDVPEERYLGKKYSPKLNKFKVKSGMPYAYWLEMGWMHEDDPYGWFEWYCKYFAGRRHLDDERQIRRWEEFCGVNGRWRKRIYRMIYESQDWEVSSRIQQSLLHWGYKVNRTDYEYYLERQHRS